MESTVNNLNPVGQLGSILRCSPASPSGRIRAALFLLYGDDASLRAMSEVLGYPHSYLSRVINGQITSAPGRRKIAAYLGMDLEDIWPAQAA